MQDKSIRLTILKTIYFIVVLVIAMLVVSHFSNGDNADMSAPMSEATLPMVTLVSGDREVNPLHGYTSEIDLSYLRGTIMPIGAARDVHYKVNTFGNKVWNLGFEVRSIDGKSLVENTEITDYRENADYIEGSFVLKDLINPGQEYMLVILMDTEIGKARYYSRFVWTEDDSKYYMDEELDFVLGFSEATFSKTEAQEYTKYLESNGDGDNTTFNKVNIHSSFNQVTWGDMTVTKHTEPEVFVKDLHGQTGIYELMYRVNIKDGTASRLYNVTECYRVRYTSDRMYLLNFERTMNYVFDSSSYALGTNTIAMNISSPDLQLVESSGGSAFAFVSENRLYMFNNSESKLAYLFGFYDTNNDDPRTRWQDHSIKILKVDEAGNVRFAVAGYMNRGIHEGAVGIAVYDYDSAMNSVEEQAFVESVQSAEILCNYVSNIAYASSADIFYVMLDQNIYAIDLLGKSASLVAQNIGAGEYKISRSESTIAWQSDLKSLKLMNLSNRVESEIKADPGDHIILLGFMGEDLVYGLCHASDVGVDTMGNPLYAMYNIRIGDLDGNILENYHPSDIYVTGVSIGENQIKLTRVVKDESGENYISTYDDQITSTLKPETGSNLVTVVSVDVFEKIVQITTKSDIKSKQLRVLTPNQTLFEGSRNVKPDIERDTKEKPFYYVYGMDGIRAIYTNPADAVKLANDAPGMVVGDDNDYVWLKGNLLRSNQNMTITRTAESYEGMDEISSTAVCIDLMLRYEGINRNVQSLLDEGESVVSILKSSLPDAQILELDGCPLSAMLYYVNQDIPVLAMLNDGSSMLVIGFNDLNTVLMNPQTGQVYKYGMNDSDKLFSDNGYHFITYIK
ncbi:hypothetical protein [Butyrivibrio sp. NC2007]|uniref:hypothetical protein n=1 Tax=Butyrivibrio sp. NC2007 TaxID=1280683 RepID=UPI0006862F1D|nr:hypothetical protein [Butyrivibrio sp. NC2007]